MIYLDHAATTPLSNAALAAMQPYFTQFFGNASSVHSAGRRAQTALNQARRTLAQSIGAQPGEIIFTSGGSESDNLALRGIALARRTRVGANRIIISALEHHAVLHTAEDLKAYFGFQLHILPVNSAGLVKSETLVEALGDGQDVALVSVMLANNEIGTIQPVAELAAHCRARQVPFHSDAVQAAGKLPLNVNELGVDTLSISAHKFYGPQGVGLLYLRNGTPFQPQQTGGSQEMNRRAGTENIPGIVGMNSALAHVEERREEENKRLTILRDRLIAGVLEEIENVRLTGPIPGEQRVCNIASFVIEGVEAEALLIALDLAGIAASSGSACVTASMKPSHVLAAIGVPATQAAGGLRFSLGTSNTPEEIEQVLAVLPGIVRNLRA